MSEPDDARAEFMGLGARSFEPLIYIEAIAKDEGGKLGDGETNGVEDREDEQRRTNEDD
jgi:hypothetical protein